MTLFDIAYKYSVEENVFMNGVIRGVPESKLHMMVVWIIGKRNILDIKESSLTPH